MAYTRILWAPAVLKAAGVPVIVEPGWATRGHGPGGGWATFAPGFVMWHHDASKVGPSPGVLAWLMTPDAPANLWVCNGCSPGPGHPDAHKRGTWHCVASGVAWGAGTGGPYATMRADDANPYTINVETDHTLGEPWSTESELLASLRVGTGALLSHMGRPVNPGLLFHATWTDMTARTRGRKVDISGLTLGSERVRVSALMRYLPPNGVPIDVVTTNELAQIAQAVWTRFEDRDGNNLATVVKNTATEVETINAKLDVILGLMGPAPVGFDDPPTTAVGG